MKTLLWLDDSRDPLQDHWLAFSPIEQPFNLVWVKRYDEFVSFILENGLPDAICFDHDLGINVQLKHRSRGKSKRESRRLAKLTEKTGYDCAKWLIDYCIDNKKELPAYNIQSANPVGKQNIDGILKSFLSKFKS